MLKYLLKLPRLLLPKRRWCQYSLATMFFVVTLFCVWLGWVVDRATRQRTAVRALRAREAVVTYDSNSSLDAHPRSDEPRLRRRLREILGDDYFCRATHVAFLANESDLDDDAIAALKRLPALSNLYIMRKPITANNLRAFGQLKKLKSLSLQLCVLNAEAVAEFRSLKNLEAFSVSGNKVAHGAADQLAKLTNLRELFLDDVQLTDADCSHLDLLTELEKLSLDGTGISDVGLARLATLGKLRELWVPYELWESAAVRRLKQTLPRCEMRISNVEQIRGMAPTKGR